MAWGTVLKTFAKGAAKKVASGAKKVKGKGKKMAENFMASRKKKRAIVVREKSTSIMQSPGGDIVKQDSSTQKPKSGSSPLDRIDSALLDIINTLKSRRKLMLAQSRRDRVQANKEKKGKREGLLEKMKAGGKKMLGNVKAAASGWWERLQRFLLMTMLGALVLAIKNNWEAIQAKITETVEFVKELWKNLEPILIPIWNIAKWITVQGFKLIGKMLGMSKDKAKVERGTDEVSQGLKDVENETGKITKEFNKSERNIKNITNTKEPNLDVKTELSESEVAEGVTTDNLGRKIKTDDQGVKWMKGSDGWQKADDRPLSETNPNTLNKPKGTRNRKKYNVGGYVTRDGEVHKGEYVIKENIVKKVGVPDIENIINMMSSSTTNIKKNPLKVISIMEGLANEFAPIGEKLPGIINETIKESKLGTVSNQVSTKMIEKMETTLSILKEQTDYEDPSGATIVISPPSQSQPSVRGGRGKTDVITIGPSMNETLNRYYGILLQKALK